MFFVVTALGPWNHTYPNVQAGACFPHCVTRVAVPKVDLYVPCCISNYPWAVVLTTPLPFMPEMQCWQVHWRDQVQSNEMLLYQPTTLHASGYILTLLWTEFSSWPRDNISVTDTAINSTLAGEDNIWAGLVFGNMYSIAEHAAQHQFKSTFVSWFVNVWWYYSIKLSLSEPLSCGVGI